MICTPKTTTDDSFESYEEFIHHGDLSEFQWHFRHISQVVVHWIRKNPLSVVEWSGSNWSFEDSPGLNISQNQWLWVLGSSHSVNGSFSYLEPSYTYYIILHRHTHIYIILYYITLYYIIYYILYIIYIILYYIILYYILYILLYIYYIIYIILYILYIIYIILYVYIIIYIYVSIGVIPGSLYNHLLCRMILQVLTLRRTSQLEFP